MDTAQWSQEMVVKPIEEILIPINNRSNNNNILSSNSSKVDIGNDNSSMEKKLLRPPNTQAVNCPRCNSTNTKFCYYNNYSLTQPRYFCKTCRRYWTEGGTLRNIPVGGGTRKHKRAPITSNSLKKQIVPSTNTNSTTTTTHENPNPNPKMLDQGQDLNLGCYPITHDFKTISQLIQVPNFESNDNKTHLSALELLTGVSSRGCGNSNINSYVPMGMSMYSEGYSSLPTLGFSIDGIGNSGYGSVQVVEGSGNCGRVFFPFEDLKQVSSTDDQNLETNNRDQPGDSTGYWNGVLRGGSW